MNLLLKRAVASGLTGLLLLALLASCNAAGQTVDSSDTATAPITETTAAVKETLPQTETETANPETTAPITESETVTDTEAPVETAPVVISDNGKDKLTVAQPADGVSIDPLTGLVCEQAEAERRPVAIMLNNIKQALPQQQISAADVLYECQVEGGLTRLLGIYNDWEDLTAIGSIRSSREYYIDFAANHDAIYVHAGGSDAAYANLKSRKTNNIDAVNDGSVSGYFYRDPVRRQTMSYEHTLVIDGGKLNEAIAKKKYRTEYASSFDNPLNFIGATRTLDLSAGKTAKTISVKFGAHTTAFAYDAKSNRYLRSQNGAKHMDGTTDTQLGFENVIVLVCPYTFTNDDKNHIEVADVGSGVGYYMTGGKYMPIKWSKATGDSPVKLTYESGREVYLTPGKTNIEIVGYQKNVTIS